MFECEIKVPSDRGCEHAPFYFAERQRGSMDARGQRQGRRADGNIHNLNISNMNIERSRKKSGSLASSPASSTLPVWQKHFTRPQVGLAIG